MTESFKFIHAADFHLDEPMKGLSEIPSHLIDVLANAPYLAAQRIFDLAISERVDFVLLAGDLYDSESNHARAAAFLLNQFQRLADKEITVYWCGGQSDHPERWPGSIELPENVITFASTLIEHVDHRRDGVTIARIIGSGYDAKRSSVENFAAEDHECFNIGLAHGEFDPLTMEGTRIRYWALGGRHKLHKIEKSDSIIAYPGTPQGRNPKETGGHSFSLCRVDSAGKLRVQPVESDRVRWVTQKIGIREDVKVATLKTEMAERAQKLVTESTDQVILCRWHLATEGDFNPRIRCPQWKEDLLRWLREEFGRTDRGLWSFALKIDPPKNLPIEWYEEDTILGEYLRATGRYQSDESLRIHFNDYMPKGVDSSLNSGFGVMCELQREEVLRRATMLGVEYLAQHKELPAQVVES